MLFGLSFLPLFMSPDVKVNSMNVEQSMQSEKRRSHTSNMIEVPAPTPWPFVTAFGLALLLAGLVTSLAVSIVGLVVILFGAVGWFRDVLPMPKEELVAVVETPTPIFARSIRRVDHLQPGAESHRVFIPVKVHPYSAGLFGGVVGGVGMAFIACLYALIASTLRLINPALNARIAWGWFIASQVAFGLITGFIVAHSKEVETAQSWPLAARAGVEAPGLIPEQEEEQ